MGFKFNALLKTSQMKAIKVLLQKNILDDIETGRKHTKKTGRNARKAFHRIAKKKEARIAFKNELNENF